MGCWKCLTLKTLLLILTACHPDYDRAERRAWKVAPGPEWSPTADPLVPAPQNQTNPNSPAAIQLLSKIGIPTANGSQMEEALALIGLAKRATHFTCGAVSKTTTAPTQLEGRSMPLTQVELTPAVPMLVKKGHFAKAPMFQYWGGWHNGKYLRASGMPHLLVNDETCVFLAEVAGTLWPVNDGAILRPFNGKYGLGQVRSLPDTLRNALAEHL